MTEEQLQAECFQYVWNQRPDKRKRLRLVLNNPKNKREGGKLKAMGLMAGVADHMYIASPMVWLECKLPEGVQSNEQKDFQKLVESFGHKYHIYRSKEELIRYIDLYP
jgi:hypothetical protein